MQPAVFLDRDGTLIDLVPYLDDPARVQLIKGSLEAIHMLANGGYACVLVTNQSGIGRGILTEQQLSEIHAGMSRQLGGQLAGIYHCPYVPGTSDQTIIEHPDRKPGPGMLIRAAADLDLDVDCSWMVGDSLSDVLAGRHAGTRGTVLVRTGNGDEVDASHPAIDYLAADVLDAARHILASHR